MGETAEVKFMPFIAAALPRRISMGFHTEQSARETIVLSTLMTQPKWPRSVCSGRKYHIAKGTRNLAHALQRKSQLLTLGDAFCPFLQLGCVCNAASIDLPIAACKQQPTGTQEFVNNIAGRFQRAVFF